MNQAELTNQYLSTGIPNQWYLVCASEDLKDEPLGLTRLGKKIVVWRDKAGGIGAVEDVCPHRGAPLSQGVIVERGLACRYHGLVISKEGEVAEAPPVRSCAYLGNKLSLSYPVQEKAGAIWVYFRDSMDSEPPPLVLPYQLSSPEWSGFLYRQEWNCNYQTALDNRVDPMHGVYLHAVSFTLSFGEKQSEIQLERTDDGFVIERDNQKGVNIDRTEISHSPGNNIWIQTDIPYPKSAGGNIFRIIASPTPIDENRTLAWFYRYQKSSGWRRDLWRFLYKNRLDQRHADVAAQDREILEVIPDSFRSREHLLQCDIGVGALRRMLRAEAELQAARMAA